jgi:YbbR domain-containing protein
LETVIRRFLTENLGWKAGALAISLLLWWGLVGEPEITMSVSVPVQYLNMPKDMEISSDVLEQVHLEVRGPSGKLSSDGLKEAAVILNLSDVSKAGEHTFPIEPANVYTPLGVEVIRAVPSQLRVRFERRLTRKTSVTVRIGNPPPRGYRVTAQTAEPAQVTITGPESQVRDIAAVETDPLDLSGVVGRAEFNVEVFVPDPHVRLEPAQRVRVQVEVRKNDSGN